MPVPLDCIEISLNVRGTKQRIFFMTDADIDSSSLLSIQILQSQGI